LPDWPFLGQIKKNWPRFKLVGLKILVGLLAFFWLHLKLAGLKNFFALLAFFALEQVLLKENITIPVFSATHCKIFVMNSRSDVRIVILVIFEGF